MSFATGPTPLSSQELLHSFRGFSPLLQNELLALPRNFSILSGGILLCYRTNSPLFLGTPPFFQGVFFLLQAAPLQQNKLLPEYVCISSRPLHTLGIFLAPGFFSPFRSYSASRETQLHRNSWRLWRLRCLFSTLNKTLFF